MRVVVFKCLCGLVSRLEKVSLCRLSSLLFILFSLSLVITAECHFVVPRSSRNQRLNLQLTFGRIGEASRLFRGV